MSRDRGLLQIGEAAERAGLSIRTVRYYEEVGLLTPAARSEGGFRLFSAPALERLLQIKSMKPLGLTLEEMSELLELLDASAQPTGAARAGTAAERLALYAQRADERITRLERDIGQAHDLRLKIGERIGRCQAIAAQELAGLSPGTTKSRRRPAVGAADQ